jgi:hypothetical protein
MIGATLFVVPAGAGVGIMNEQFGRSLQILLGVCGLVLLIACANVREPAARSRCCAERPAGCETLDARYAGTQLARREQPSNQWRDAARVEKVAAHKESTYSPRFRRRSSASQRRSNCCTRARH